MKVQSPELGFTPDVPQELQECYLNARVIPFVGAGISAAIVRESGQRPPSYSGFVSGIIDQARENKLIKKEEKKQLKKLIDSGDLKTASKRIRVKLSERDFGLIVRQFFKDVDPKPSQHHTILNLLRFKFYLTTNYDRILDQIISPRPEVLTYEDHALFQGLMLEDYKDAAPVLLKLNGDISRPITIALGKSEEIGMWDHDSDLGQGLLGLFQSLVAKFTILFLGYSFQDPDYRKFLIRVGRMVPQSQHFALMQKNEWEKIPSSDQTLLIEEAKIQPIFYKIANSKSHDAYRCLWQFLSHLPKKVDQPLQIVNGKQAGSFYLAQERQDYLAQQNAFEKRCQGIRYLTEGLTNAIATKEYILKHCGKKLEGFKPIFFKDFSLESEEFYEAESDWVLWKHRVLNAMIERTRTLEQRLEDGCEMRILCQKDATLKEIESGDSTVIGRYEKMLRFVDNECYDVEIRLSSGYSVSRSLGSFASMIEGHGKGANIAVAYATQARSVEFTTHFFEVNSRFAEESLTRFESEWVRANNELKSRNQIYNRLEERKSEL